MADIAERLSSALADRYRIEREFGAGGMATVYLAQDLRHDRKVVIKGGLRGVMGRDRGPRAGAHRGGIWEGDGGILGRVSVNGRWIALARTVPGTARTGSDILVFRRDSSAPRPYLATRFEETAPAISPDGRWLAYVSDETGRREVYVGAFPDASAGRRVVSTQGAKEPQWSRDGRTLFYRTLEGMLVAHEVRTAPALTIGPPRPLFSAPYDASDDGADFDVHPAGDRFVMLATRPVGSQLVWILNAVPAR